MSAPASAAPAVPVAQHKKALACIQQMVETMPMTQTENRDPRYVDFCFGVCRNIFNLAPLWIVDDQGRRWTMRDEDYPDGALVATLNPARDHATIVVQENESGIKYVLLPDTWHKLNGDIQMSDFIHMPGGARLGVHPTTTMSKDETGEQYIRRTFVPMTVPLVRAPPPTFDDVFKSMFGRV